MLISKQFATLSILEVAELAQKAQKLRLEMNEPECSEESSVEAETLLLDAEADAAAGFRYLVAVGILPEMPEQLEHYTPADISAILNDRMKEMYGVVCP